MRFVLIALGAALSVLAGLGRASPPGVYSYGGVASRSPVRAIVATVTLLEPASVESGHVAAWVGVGGPGLGPGGVDEWVQVGIAEFTAERTGNVYYEIKRGQLYRFGTLPSEVAVGERHTLGVVELRSRPGWWRVWVDGRPWGPPVLLPGSHEAWPGQAMAESWTTGAPQCNSFGFAFAGVEAQSFATGPWTALKNPVRFGQDGFAVSIAGRSLTVRRRC